MRTRLHSTSGTSSKDLGSLTDSSLSSARRASSTSAVPHTTSSDRRMMSVLVQRCMRSAMLRYLSVHVRLVCSFSRTLFCSKTSSSLLCSACLFYCMHSALRGFTALDARTFGAINANHCHCYDTIRQKSLTWNNKKAQLSLTNPRDAKVCQKLLQFDVPTTLSLTILAYLHAFNCCCFRNPRNPEKFTENSNLWSSRSSKVIDLGANRKPICDFILVINSNFSCICYRSRDIHG